MINEHENKHPPAPSKYRFFYHSVVPARKATNISDLKHFPLSGKPIVKWNALHVLFLFFCSFSFYIFIFCIILCVCDFGVCCVYAIQSISFSSAHSLRFFHLPSIFLVGFAMGINFPTSKFVHSVIAEIFVSVHCHSIHALLSFVFNFLNEFCETVDNITRIFFFYFYPSDVQSDIVNEIGCNWKIKYFQVNGKRAIDFK